MTDTLRIILIAAGVCGAAFVIWLIAALRDGRRLRGMRQFTPETKRRIYEAVEEEARRRGASRSSRVERVPYKREVPGSSPGGTKDDSTVTLPPGGME